MKAYPYLIEDPTNKTGEKLIPLDPRNNEYNEDWLQEFLMNHPDILPTGKIETIFSPLVPIGKEVNVKGGRIDILYLSASGYPVIVETKLWRNPESKREVVAQILDLAFSFSKWKYDQLDEYIKHFTKVYYGQQKSLIALMTDKFGEINWEMSDFRNHVENNLNLGRFLVVVIGDKIRTSAFELITELNRLPGLGLKLAMIEIECFKLNSGKIPLLLIPRIAIKSEIIERSIVEIKIKHDQLEPDIQIYQEKAKNIGKKTGHLTITEADFWEKLQEKAPNEYQELKNFVEDLTENSLIEMEPGTNGLKFRKVLTESNQIISLFFITTDSSINVRLQDPRKQFKSLGFDLTIVDEFGNEVRSILNGYKSLFKNIDKDSFTKTLLKFCKNIDEQEIIEAKS